MRQPVPLEPRQVPGDLLTDARCGLVAPRTDPREFVRRDIGLLARTVDPCEREDRIEIDPLIVQYGRPNLDEAGIDVDEHIEACIHKVSDRPGNTGIMAYQKTARNIPAPGPDVCHRPTIGDEY
ncbi:hypothetical protein [Nannocystis pusilla]|uniref:hypothetical protein n=1 Tax=Nannocystis pusilla TaxID=889268 RepID=UPI003B779EE9